MPSSFLHKFEIVLEDEKVFMLVIHYFPFQLLKILGLDICADTIVGNNMMRGISGGQKKRVTTGNVSWE